MRSLILGRYRVAAEACSSPATARCELATARPMVNAAGITRTAAANEPGWAGVIRGHFMPAPAYGWSCVRPALCRPLLLQVRFREKSGLRPDIVRKVDDDRRRLTMPDGR